MMYTDNDICLKNCLPVICPRVYVCNTWYMYMYTYIVHVHTLYMYCTRTCASFFLPSHLSFLKISILLDNKLNSLDMYNVYSCGAIGEVCREEWLVVQDWTE